MQRPTRTLTTRQMAEALGVSESSVKRWVDDGRIGAERTAGGHRRIPVESAVAFMREHGGRPLDASLLGLGVSPELGEVDGSACAALARALERDDVVRVKAVVTGRFLSGAGVGAIADGLVWPALEAVGDLEGLEGRRAVHAVLEVMHQVGGWLPEPEGEAPAAVTAAVGGNPVLPLLASLVLRERGVRARNLGANVPLETVCDASRRYRPGVCLLGVAEAAAGDGWARMADGVEASGGRLALVGPGAAALGAALGGRATVCERVGDVAALVGEAVGV